eukprot:1418596-Amphidinium_carterae.1
MRETDEIGQHLERVAGWAAQRCGAKRSTPRHADAGDSGSHHHGHRLWLTAQGSKVWWLALPDTRCSAFIALQLEPLMIY